MAWNLAHPRLQTWISRILIVRLWLSLVWVLGLLIFVPPARGPIRAYAGSFLIMVVWFVIVRTKTIGWRLVAGMFSISVMWSAAVAWVTVLVAGMIGLTAEGDGAGTALAGLVEEPGKLIPLLALAVAAPGRVRRFGAGDWAALGFTCGVGFNAFEDALRQAAGQVNPWIHPSQWVKEYSLNPWTSAVFKTTDGVAVAAGHHIWTATIAMALGLSIAWWRGARSQWSRATAAALPVGAMLLVVADHVGFNAHSRDAGWPSTGGQGLPPVLSAVWSAAGHGRATTVISALLLAACLLVDARRRQVASQRGALDVPGAWPGDSAAEWVTERVQSLTASFGRGPAVERVMSGVQLVCTTGVQALSQAFNDLAVVVAAHQRLPGESRRSAARRARRVASAVRRARCVAMAVTTPGAEPRSRRVFAAVVALGGSMVVGWCLWWGADVAAAVGPVLGRDGDGAFLAGYLDGAGDWWDSIGPVGQIAVGVGVAALIALSGGSLGVAFGIAGVASYGLEKAHGAASFARDPARATADYLATTTPGDFLIDTGEFALTFAPGNFAGAAVARGARGAVREFAADPEAFMAARRIGAARDAGEVYPGAFRDDTSRPRPARDFVPPTNPPQAPPTSPPAGYSVRVSGPTQQYPNGYWRLTNERHQYVDPSTGKPPSNVTRAESRARTHIELPQDWS